MLVLNGTFRVPKGGLEALREAAAVQIAATLKEPGCLRYAFAQDLHDPTLIHITEAWTDRAALDAHFAMPHMLTWRVALADIGTYDRKLLAHEAAEGSPV